MPLTKLPKGIKDSLAQIEKTMETKIHDDTVGTKIRRVDYDIKLRLLSTVQGYDNHSLELKFEP